MKSAVYVMDADCVQRYAEMTQLKKRISIIFAGRGGQGILTASSITAQAFFLSGYDVKKSDIKGIARRGGRVLSTLVAGEKVHDPKIVPEKADIALILSRDLDFKFSENTMLIVPNDEEIESYKMNLNMFCLGKLSRFIDIPVENWVLAIKERFGDGTSQSNISAFFDGKASEKIFEASS